MVCFHFRKPSQTGFSKRKVFCPSAGGEEDGAISEGQTCLAPSTVARMETMEGASKICWTVLGAGVRSGANGNGKRLGDHSKIRDRF